MVERYVAESSLRVRPRPLTPPSSPPVPLPCHRDQQKIYGHANYPLKLRETSPRPLRRPYIHANAPPLQGTLKIRPIKLFEKPPLRDRPRALPFAEFRDRVFNLRSIPSDFHPPSPIRRYL